MTFLKNVAKGALMTAGLIGVVVCLVVAQIIITEAIGAGGPLVAAVSAGLAICLSGGLIYAVWRTGP